MRVRQISVKNLFGVFNHSIPLNMEERITIIHGPNGTGKTVLLRMIEGLFKGDFQLLRAIPFTEFRVDFDDGGNIVLAKDGQLELPLPSAPDAQLIKFAFTDSKSEKWEIPFLGLTLEESEQLLGRPHNEWDSKPHLDPKLKEIVDTCSKLIRAVPIRLIETERLAHMQAVNPMPLLPRGATEAVDSRVSNVEKYAQDLSQRIESTLAESANLSQSLAGTFPARLVEENSSTLTEGEIRAQLKKLEEDRSRLMAVGLLDKNGSSSFQSLSKIDEHTRKVLSIYVSDEKQKLGMFDNLAKKIEFFKGAINKRFLYKRMGINKEDGYTFTTIDQKTLPPTKLSSGEQHELVLLYELLFKVQSNSLTLIDEPELSLHVAWQQQFLEDLHEIVKLSSIDVLIATHSPQIIHDRWDLTVELKGPAR